VTIFLINPYNLAETPKFESESQFIKIVDVRPGVNPTFLLVAV